LVHGHNRGGFDCEGDSAFGFNMEGPAMTAETMNRKLAEWMGHRYHKPTEAEVKSGSYYQYEPDYTKSLDAVAEAEARLVGNVKLIHRYQVECFKILSVDGSAPTIFCYLKMTALQRCTALCHALGLWKEDV
jgi:hypothetical protein